METGDDELAEETEVEATLSLFCEVDEDDGAGRLPGAQSTGESSVHKQKQHNNTTSIVMLKAMAR